MALDGEDTAFLQQARRDGGNLIEVDFAPHPVENDNSQNGCPLSLIACPLGDGGKKNGKTKGRKNNGKTKGGKKNGKTEGGKIDSEDDESEEVESILVEGDKNNDGVLTFTEFVEIFPPEAGEEADDVEADFMKADLDGDGVLNQTELFDMIEDED